MAELFLKVVNMSISATWMVLIVLVVRVFLKKAPKWISILLWALVGLRLICPFSFESMFSLIPSSETVRPEIMVDPAPSIQTGVAFLDNAVNPIILQTFATAPSASVNPLQIVIPVVANLWLLGIAALVLYTAVSYFRLKLRLREATLYKENIYQSENIPAPFVLGFLKPLIYLPYNMTVLDMQHVIAHEQAHIQRKDYLWKPMGFFILSIHWFNPVMWLAYAIFCRDIEMCCDEKVVRSLLPEQRADYSTALLTCGSGRRRIAPCPLAFGEASIKGRIKAVLQYKKPALWILIAAVVLCVAIAVCFLTNPIQDTNLGIQDLVVKDASGGHITLELPYNYLWGRWAVSMVPEGAGEDTSNGSIPYDGSLGKYRLLISFGDSGLTDRFMEKFAAGQVLVLDNVPESFGGSLRAKIWTPQDHGFVIYIGSDVPFTVKEQSGSGEHFYGRITIPVISLDGNAAVASYNGLFLTREILEHNRRMREMVGGNPLTDLELINLIFENRMLLEEAQRQGIVVTQEDIGAYMDSLERGYALPEGKEQVDAWLQAMNMTLEEYYAQHRKQAPDVIMRNRLKDSIMKQYCEKNGREFRKDKVTQDMIDAREAYIKNLFERNKHKIKYYIDL